MLNCPLPSHHLCLSFGFSLNEATSKKYQAQDHQAACGKAAKLVGLMPADKVLAIISPVTEKPADMPTLKWAHDQPLPDAAYGQAVWDKTFAVYEFFYSQKKNKVAEEASLGEMYLGVRILVNLGVTDGVTATRVLFHTMEVLEGVDDKKVAVSSFKRNPKIVFSWRQPFNILCAVCFVFPAIAWAWVQYFCESIGLKTRAPSSDSAAVNNPLSMLNHYRDETTKHTLAIFNVLSTDKQEYPYRNFLRDIDEWRIRLGLRRYFYLVNFDPSVCPGLTNNYRDLLGTMEKRYANALVTTPGTPPPPEAFNIQNGLMADTIFINNYGNHNHAITPKLTAFVWDWTGLAANLHGAGALTLNGRSSYWTRGLPYSHSLAGDLLTSKVARGKVQSMTQLDVKKTTSSFTHFLEYFRGK